MEKTNNAKNKNHKKQVPHKKTMKKNNAKKHVRKLEKHVFRITSATSERQSYVELNKFDI